MARLANDVVVVSKPVRTFPNGDYFYLELFRKNSRYEVVVCMRCASKPESPVIMARGQGKTIHEAEEICYRTALLRCPSFPKPPYFKRGERTQRIVPTFRTTVARDTQDKETLVKKAVR